MIDICFIVQIHPGVYRNDKVRYGSLKEMHDRPMMLFFIFLTLI